MKLKINLFNWLVICLCTYSTFIFLYKLTNDFFPFTKLFGMAVAFLVLLILFRSIKREEALTIIFIGVAIIFTFITSKDLKTNLKDGIYWVSTLLFLLVVKKRRNVYSLIHSLIENKKYLFFILILNNAIFIFELLNPECYGGAWGNRYFLGYAYSNHVMASGACLHLCLSLFYIRNIKSNFLKIIWMLPASFVILESGARVYIVSLAIIWYVIYFHILNNLNFKIIIFPFAFVAALYFFWNSGIMHKFLNPNIYATTKGLEHFTSGRSVFWLIDLRNFAGLNPINQFTGRGFDYPYIVNETYYNFRIWSHNDFINCLLSVGLYGTCIYTFIVYKNIKCLYANKIIIFVVSFYYLFVAIINGLFAYQHYLYSYIILYCFATLLKCSKTFDMGKGRFDEKDTLFLQHVYAIDCVYSNTEKTV